jgi:purine-binding chemotaxis protein CheW
MAKQTGPSDNKPARAIDWGEIRARIENSRSAIESGWMPSAETTNKVLEDRARALAREAKGNEAAGEEIEILEFLLAYERYGIESSYIREVCSLKELTPLVCTAPFVSGIINVRGQIISVIDIKKFFDLPEKGLTDLNKVVIIRNGTMEFGILADVILGMRRVALRDIQPSLPTLTGIREQYLKGVTRERLVILDADKLLTDKNIVVHEESEM